MKETIEQIEKLLGTLQNEKNQTVFLNSAIGHLTHALAALATHVKKGGTGVSSVVSGGAPETAHEVKNSKRAATDNSQLQTK